MNLICAWNVTLHIMLSLRTNDRCGRPNHPLECQMSKRKPATASTHAHNTKIAAHQANQAIIRSPKASPPRSVAAGSTESPPESHNDSKQEAPLVEKPEAPPVEKPATALQDDCRQTMTDNDSKKGFVFLQPPQTCGLIKQSCWKWHKPTCNWLLNSPRGLRRLNLPLKLSASLQNLQASGSPCSRSIR